MHLSTKTRRQLQFQKIVFLILFSTIIGLLAWLSNHYSTQIDLTSNHRNSLSRTSVDLLNTFDGKIIFNAYIRNQTTRQAVKEIIQRYQQIKPDIELHFYNPDIAFKQAEADNVVLKNNIAFVIHYKNRQQNIYSLSENTITNALYRLSLQGKQSIVFITGHNERNPFDKSSRGYSKLSKILEKRGFNIDTVNLLVHPLSGHTRLLVIASPEKQLGKGVVAQILTYLKRGHNLLWLMDVGPLQGLKPLSTMMDIKFLPGVIIDNNTNLRRTLNIQHPAIIPVIDYPEHPITHQLNYTLFPIARGIRTTGMQNRWEQTPILRSLPKSWVETSNLTGKITFDPDKGDIAGPVTFGLALERKIKSAQKATRNSKTSQRLVVIGDTDFLANSYIGAGDNIALATKIFNWLNNDDKLLKIAPIRHTDLKLDLNDTWISVIGFGFYLVLPLTLLVAGFTLWYKRNKR